MIYSVDPVKLDRFGPSMLVVALYLESFFNETIGLAKLTSLPQVSLSSTVPRASESLDATAIGFSTVTLFASSTHIEDLSSLVSGLGRSQVGKSPSKSKKLRPSIVRGGISLEANRLFPESQSEGVSFSPVVEWKSSAFNGWAGTSGKESRSIQARLIDAFFHQHRDLKEVCEFAVNQVLKNTSSQVLSACIRPAFEEKGLTICSSEREFEDAQRSGLDLSRQYLRDLLGESVRRSLGVLGPPGLHPKVMDIATSLAMTRGVNAGQAMLHSLVVHALQSLRDSLEREEKKQSIKNLIPTCPDQPVSSEHKAFEDVISSIEGLEALFSSSFENRSALDVTTLLLDANRHATAFTASLGTSIPSESSLRRLFDQLLHLDRSSHSFIEWSLALDDDDCYTILLPFLRTAIELSRVANYGLRCLSGPLKKDFILRLITSSAGANSCTEEVTSILLEIFGAGLIRLSELTAFLDSSEANSRVKAVLGLVESKLLGAQPIIVMKLTQNTAQVTVNRLGDKHN
jgi:hypothetical protein